MHFFLLELRTQVAGRKQNGLPAEEVFRWQAVLKSIQSWISMVKAAGHGKTLRDNNTRNPTSRRSGAG
jgi:hypothetical protein